MSLADDTPANAVIADAGEYSLPIAQGQLFKNQCIVHFFPNRRTGSDLTFSSTLGVIQFYRPRLPHELKYAEQMRLSVRSILDEDQSGKWGYRT
jgi:hypothetical protein